MSDQKVICCDVFDQIARSLDWFSIKDVILMPHIKMNSEKYFVNNCPVCGKSIRGKQYNSDEFYKLPSL